MENIIEKIKEVLDNTLGEDMSKIASEIGIEENLYNIGLDSLNIVKLVVGLEDEFNIEFTDEEISGANWRTLDTIANLLDSKGV